jgi:hypothetical protein
MLFCLSGDTVLEVWALENELCCCGCGGVKGYEILGVPLEPLSITFVECDVQMCFLV